MANTPVPAPRPAYRPDGVTCTLVDGRMQVIGGGTPQVDVFVPRPNQTAFELTALPQTRPWCYVNGMLQDDGDYEVQSQDLTWTSSHFPLTSSDKLVAIYNR